MTILDASFYLKGEDHTKADPPPTAKNDNFRGI